MMKRNARQNNYASVNAQDEQHNQNVFPEIQERKVVHTSKGREVIGQGIISGQRMNGYFPSTYKEISLGKTQHAINLFQGNQNVA